MPETPRVCCPTCHGAGTVVLTGRYADTLALLRRQRGEVCGTALAAVAGCKVPAMCNRLAALERLGLATSRRYGCKRLYRVEEG